ncbi:MAG: hypothetical protein FWD34_03095 [Oscillospiraceae bacterium]|nr:hypothetical protein [Oscillospiraceae bacterium]
MNIKRKPIYIIVAVFVMLAMVLTMAACKNNESNYDDRDRDRDRDKDDNKVIANVPYEEAEKSFVKGTTRMYSSFNAMAQTIQDGEGGSLVFSFTPEDYILDLMRGSGIDVPARINPTVFEINSEIKGNDMYAGYAYKNGNKEILAMDMWLSGNTLIMYIPKLADKYLSMYIDSDDMTMMMQSLYSPLEMDMPNLPSEAAVDRLLDAVWQEYFELTKGAPVEKDVAITIGSMNVNCDVATVEMDNVMFGKLVIAFLEAVADNKEIKDFITEMVKESDPYYYYDFDIDEILREAIDEIKYDLVDYPSEDGGTVLMKVYVNGADIVKREFTAIEYDGEKMMYASYANIEKGGKYELDVMYETYYDGTYVRVTDSGNKSGGSSTGKMSMSTVYEEYDWWQGEYVIKTMSCTLDYKDVTVDRDGAFTGGEITFASDNMYEESFSLELKFRKDNFGGSLIVGGVKFATVEMTWKSGYSGKPAPSLNANNSVDMDDYWSDAYYEVSDQMETNLMNMADSLDDNGIYDIIAFMFNMAMSY